MKINVEHIAKLSKLKIEEDKLQKFEKDMQNIVDMVEQLPNIEIVEDGLHPENPLIFREDKSSEERLTRDELLANAPSIQAGCFVVPKTLE